MTSEPQPQGASAENIGQLRRRLEEAEAARTAAESRVEELSDVIRDVAVRERAIDYFTEQSVEDPRRWATVALPHIRDASVDEVGERLSELFPDVPTKPDARGDTAAVPQPATDSPEPPETARPGFVQPNPAADGIPPSADKLRPGTEAFLKRFAGASIGDVRAAHERGEVDINPRSAERHGLPT